MKQNPLGLKIAVLGMGLMGGSLALSLSRNGFIVTGWDQNEEIRHKAFAIGALSCLTTSLEATVAQADLIFIATPVTVITECLRDCLPFVKKGVIFSDLGSIKGEIIEQVFSFLNDDYHFVPGHPMTGSEQSGIGGADPFLFQNATYVLIEDPGIEKEVLETVAQIVKMTGAELIKLTAAQHDRIVGMVSHLPHLLAAVLAKTAGESEKNYSGTLGLAAGGFRDTTRVALGSPELWQGIIFGNRSEVWKAIKLFQKELDELLNIIANENPGELRDFLAKGREVREQIPAKNKGFLTLLYEIVVTIEDRPGTINAVLQHLSLAGINIKDIEILRIREGDGGTLRLALENYEGMIEAVQVLESASFKVRKRLI